MIHLNGPTAPPALRVLAGLTHCCAGAGMYGPDRCTCWTPIYDLEQTPIPETGPLPDVDPTERSRMCDDCAFRPDSPESTGDDRYSHSGDTDRLNLVFGVRPFWCHTGMRKPIAWRHPLGITVDCDTDGYAAPILHGVPHQADGTVGEVCAGWLAARRQAGVSDDPYLIATWEADGSIVQPYGFLDRCEHIDWIATVDRPELVTCSGCGRVELWSADAERPTEVRPVADAERFDQDEVAP